MEGTPCEAARARLMARFKAVALMDDGLAVEASVRRLPYSVKLWVAYIQYKKSLGWTERRMLYERATQMVPRSYKLWWAYVREGVEKVEGRWTTTGRAKVVTGILERAVSHFHLSPRLWVSYCEALKERGFVGETRRAYDRALRALPVTQHHLIWPGLCAFAKDICGEPFGSACLRRRCMLDFDQNEVFAEYLQAQGKRDGAALVLKQCLIDPCFKSPKNSSRHGLWMRLCDLCCSGDELDPDVLIKAGLAQLTEDVSCLWCKLADYHVRRGRFERARDIFEEAVTTVLLVRDFAAVFDAYARFEESVVAAKMRMKENDDDDHNDEEGDEQVEDLDLRLARLEDLIQRRPVLLSSVILRQNPHNVREWLTRTALFDDNPVKKIETFSYAVKMVDPNVATGGKVSALWLGFAGFYAENNGFESDARFVLRKAIAQPFKTVDELAEVVCFWIESELDRGYYDTARSVAKVVLLKPLSMSSSSFGGGRSTFECERSTVERLARYSTKVWGLYLDLEESLGTVDAARAAYDWSIDLKVASPQMVLNYAALLNECDYFEDAFKVYERGLTLFETAWVRDLWLAYASALTDRLVARQSKTKSDVEAEEDSEQLEPKKRKGRTAPYRNTERVRDLYERCLACIEAAPSEKKKPGYVPMNDAASCYVVYARFEEEDCGQPRKAVEIYRRACAYATNAAPEMAMDAWMVYAKKVELHYGAVKARAVFEAALPVLADGVAARTASLRFARLEIALGDVDRARAVYAHGAQYAHPEVQPSYYDAWRAFEVNHGNEDTFRDMLLVKRSVQIAIDVNQNFVAKSQVSLAMRQPTDVQDTHLDRDAGDVPRKPADDHAPGGGGDSQIAALERASAQPRLEAPPQPPDIDPYEIQLDDDDDTQPQANPERHPV